MNFQDFFLNYGLLILLGALLVFMFWNSSRRMKKQREEQAQKASQTVPGAQVLLQGGLYGTIVEFDPDNLDQPALVEIAPGVDIKVHSQAILRIITPADEVDGCNVLIRHRRAQADTAHRQAKLLALFVGEGSCRIRCPGLSS